MLDNLWDASIVESLRANTSTELAHYLVRGPGWPSPRHLPPGTTNKVMSSGSERDKSRKADPV